MIELFIGKGGVGKSTSSSLHAVQEASSGSRTLLDSMDPAHNLHDIFKCSLGSKAAKAAPDLYIRETDMEKMSRNYMNSVRKGMKGLYHYQQALNIDKYFNILKFAPGMEEYAAWLALEVCYNETGYDHIIIDTPPTALTMKTLALSSVNLMWLKQLEAMRKEIIEKKNAVSRIRKENMERLEEDPVYGRLQTMKVRYEKMLANLRDPGKTGIMLVMNNDELSIAESRQIIKDLKNLGIGVASIIMNKFAAGTEKNLPEDFRSIPVEYIPDFGRSPTGIETLQSHGREIQYSYSVLN